MQSAHSHIADDQVVLLLIDCSVNNANKLESMISASQLGNYTICRSLSALNDLSPLPASAVIILSSNLIQGTQALLIRIQAVCPHNPVIIAGDTIQSDDANSLINAGAFDYVALPQLSHSELIRAIRYSRTAERHQREISALRNADPLTSVCNRQYFYKRGTELFNNAQQNMVQMALLSIDLDGFWRFNTRNGHHAGDQVVSQFCDRLKRSLANEGLFARIGQDEFVALITCDTTENIENRIKALAARVMMASNKAFQYDDSHAFLPCSIGIAISHPNSSLDTLVKNAGLARLSAKKNQTCSYVLYDEFLRQSDTREHELEPDLANALRREEFELFLQPQVSLSSGRIIGAEALIRWHHPKRGLVMPGDFIDLCERNGMIIPIGYWAIHNAGMQLQTLRDNGFDDCRISVNLSFRQFQDIQLSTIIKRIIQQNNIQSDFLSLELTESALIRDEQHVTRCLEELSCLNVKFSLDDFGTGYSSFSLLQKLPISALKIDRSFIRDVTTNSSDAEIVKVIINLAKNLDKEVVAEGIETEEQLAFLQSLGCDQVQGYYYSPPVPLDEFLVLINHHNRRSI